MTKERMIKEAEALKETRLRGHVASLVCRAVNEKFIDNDMAEFMADLLVAGKENIRPVINTLIKELKK